MLAFPKSAVKLNLPVASMAAIGLEYAAPWMIFPVTPIARVSSKTDVAKDTPTCLASSKSPWSDPLIVHGQAPGETVIGIGV